MIRVLFLLFLGLVFWAVVSVPNFGAASKRANVRACFANQKTLAGAIEMHNLDFHSTITTLDSETHQKFVTDGYLSYRLNDPGFGPNTSFHYQVVPQGEYLSMLCIKHGPIQGGATFRIKEALRAAKIKDPRVLKEAEETPLRGSALEIRKWRAVLKAGYPYRLALRLLTVAVFPFHAQSALLERYSFSAWVR